MDLTDLETFGGTTLSKRPKIQNAQDTCDNSKKVITSPTSRKTRRTSERLLSKNSSSKLQEEINTSLTDTDDPAGEPIVSQSPAGTEQMKQDSDQACEQEETLSGDSEDDRLVIDDLRSSATTPTPQPKPETSPHSPDPLISLTPESVPSSSPPSSSPQNSKGPRRKSKRLSASGDQLGEILRMQTAMLNPAKDTSKHTVPQETTSHQSTGPSVHSLVKPCVSSYLESSQRHDGETEAAPHNGPPSSFNVKTPERKSECQRDFHTVRFMSWQ